MDWAVSLVTLKLNTLCAPEGAIEADIGTKEKAAAETTMSTIRNTIMERRLTFIIPPYIGEAAIPEKALSSHDAKHLFSRTIYHIGIFNAMR
jgi:uncharacterized protein YdaL